MPSNQIDITVAVISATLALVSLGFFIILFVFFHKRKQHENQLERQNLENRYRQELLQTQLEIQEQTLKNISEEIHDNIGQVLSLTKLNLGTIDFGNNQVVTQKVEASRQLVSKAIQDLRDLSRSLNTDYVVQMGLHRAVEYELELLQKAGKHQTALHTSGAAYRLDNQKELILFRLIQEVLNNIMKHANATNVQVNIDFFQQQLILTVYDNGSGFDPQQYSDPGHLSKGMGLRNMQNRARMIGASFELHSEPGHGTTIKISLPVTSNPATNGNI